MILPPSDLNAFSQALTETAEEIIERWRESNVRAAADESDPEVLWNAFGQLLPVLARYEERPPDGGVDVSELGDYGLNMLLDLERIAAGLGLDRCRGRLEQISVGLALWIVRHDGEISTLELIVNGLANAANSLRSQTDLERLFFATEEITQGVAPGPQQEAGSMAGSPRQNPWMLLLMNRAIIATRALSPPLMEKAFGDIAEQLPEIAPDFFKEAVGQIPLRGYPPAVAEVITRFHQLTTVPKTLH